LSDTKKNKWMFSVSKTEILKARLRATVQNDSLITLRQAKATIAAIAGVPISQKLVRVVLETPGSSPESEY